MMLVPIILCYKNNLDLRDVGMCVISFTLPNTLYISIHVFKKKMSVALQIIHVCIDKARFSLDCSHLNTSEGNLHSKPLALGSGPSLV